MKTISAAFLLFVLILLLAACSPAAAPAPSATLRPTLPPPTPVPSQTPLPPTATPAPEIPLAPASLIPLEDRLISTVNINFPDQMIFVQGFLWVKTSNGHLIQVDPATSTILVDIKIDTTSDAYHYCFGLGTDGSHVWACSATGDADHQSIDVVRIDPQSQSVTATLPVGKIFDQRIMPFLDQRIWVLTGSGDQLVGIDVETNEPDPPIDLGMRCFALGALGDSLFAACTFENLVVKIDPRTGSITGQAEVRSPRSLVAGESSLWALQDTKLVRIDPNTMSTLAVFAGLPELGVLGDVFVGPDAIWARNPNGFLVHIDPVTNAYVEQFVPDPPVPGGSVLVTDDAIWVTTYHDGMLMKIARE